MAVRMMPASDVRKRLHQLLNALDDRPLYITAHGRARAVLLDVDRYDRLIEQLEDLADACDPEVARALAEAKAAPGDELVPLDEALRQHGLQRNADEGGQ